MGMEEIWELYTSSERDLFQKACRRLLKSTFIVRDKDEDSKRAYYFISRNPDVFSLYFKYIGFDISVDRDNGVVMLRNCREASENGRMQINHYVLKKAESILLCCLWTLYADRLREGNLSRTVSISVTELRFELEKYGIRDQIDKSTVSGALALFSRFSLVDVKGRIGEEDCRILLYPSLQFALDPAEFDRFVSVTAKRMWEEPDEDGGDPTDEGEESDEQTDEPAD